MSAGGLSRGLDRVSRGLDRSEILRGLGRDVIARSLIVGRVSQPSGGPVVLIGHSEVHARY